MAATDPTRLYRLDRDPPTVDFAVVRADTAPLPALPALPVLADRAARHAARTRLAEQLSLWAVATLALTGFVLLLSVALYCTPWGWNVVMGR